MDALRYLLFLYCRWYFLEFLKQWTCKEDDLSEDTKVQLQNSKHVQIFNIKSLSPLLNITVLFHRSRLWSRRSIPGIRDI